MTIVKFCGYVMDMCFTYYEMLRKSMANIFPYFAKGKVVKGFGRGSKELGIPTANFPEEVVDSLPGEFNSGVYYGWATVDDGPIHKMVMSVGWNPHFKNTKRSMETHIMHKFDDDFYGSMLKVCVTGYLREEKSFESLDALIDAINKDIEQANEKLDLPVNQVYKEDSFFVSSANKSL